MSFPSFICNIIAKLNNLPILYSAVSSERVEKPLVKLLLGNNLFAKHLCSVERDLNERLGCEQCGADYFCRYCEASESLKCPKCEKKIRCLDCENLTWADCGKCGSFFECLECKPVDDQGPEYEVIDTDKLLEEIEAIEGYDLKDYVLEAVNQARDAVNYPGWLTFLSHAIEEVGGSSTGLRLNPEDSSQDD